MINDLPTLFEVVSGTTKKQSKEKSSATKNGSSKSKSKTNSKSARASKQAPPAEEDDGVDEEDKNEHGDAQCGACGENYASDDVWICCDLCGTWFHGKCVKIILAKAAHNKQYKCPFCNNKRARS